MVRPSQRGVTVIELIITVAVLAVLLAIAVPSFADYFERTRLRAAADDLVSLAQQARAEAVRLNLPVAVIFRGNATDWCVGASAASMPAAGVKLPNAVPAAQRCDCSAQVCTIANSETRVRSASYGAVTLGEFAAADDNFDIDPRLGILTNVAATPSVLLTSEKARFRLRVTVSPLGVARACVPAGERSISGYGSC